MPTSVTNGWKNKVTAVEHPSCTHLEVKCFPSHLCAHAILHGSVRQGALPCAQHAGLVVSQVLESKEAVHIQPRFSKLEGELSAHVFYARSCYCA